MDSLKEALRAQLDKALEAGARADDHSVHEARKELKRARATLRLMRVAMGNVQYSGANHRLRDAAHPLRLPRDAAALLKTLDKVARRGDEYGMKSLTDRLRRQLRQDRGSAGAGHSDGARQVDAGEIRKVERQIMGLPMRQTDARSARRGIKKSYRIGHRAFAMACLDPSDFLLHEWRKQAKYLANELELARGLLQLGFKKAHRRAVELASVLGDDHDLASLCDKLCEFQASATPPLAARSLEKLKQRIEHKRRKLQAKAYRRGRKLYGHSTHKIGARLKHELH